MKFYIDKGSWNYWSKINDNKLDAIYYDIGSWFFKNGELYNTKNAAYKGNSGFKEFNLNGKVYGTEKDFTKESWRRFVKLQAFL
jgi:hypothetical protein